MYFYSSEINSASIKTRKSVLKGTLFDGDQKLLEEISTKVVFKEVFSGSKIIFRIVSQYESFSRLVKRVKYKASVRRREESDEMHILPLLSGLYPL